MWTVSLVAVLLVSLVDNARCEDRTSKKQEVELITEPRPGEEYVLFQSGPVQLGNSRASPRNYVNKGYEVTEPDYYDITTYKPQKNKTSGEPLLMEILTGAILNPENVLPAGEAATTYRPSSTTDEQEVQTSVSVVTSRAVLVQGGLQQPGGVQIVPEALTGVRAVPPFDEVERKIMQRKSQAAAESVAKAESHKVTKKDEADPDHEVKKKVHGGGIEIKPESRSGFKVPATNGQERKAPLDVTIAPDVNSQSTLIPETTNPEPTTDYEDLVQPLSTPPAPYKSELVSVNLFGKNVEKNDFRLGKGTDLDDKVLVPAESAQTSRVNYKKAPNGQDYEYEYVYYYYDDEDDGNATQPAKTNAHDGPAIESLQPEKMTETTTTTTTPQPTTTTTTAATTTTTTTEKTSRRQYLPTGGAAVNRVHHDDISSETLRPPSRGRGSDSRGKNSRGRFYSSREEDHSFEDASTTIAPRHRGRGSSSSRGSDDTSPTGRSRFRYTTIERNRGSGSREETSSEETDRPASNEVVPARGSRFRGRQSQSQEDNSLSAEGQGEAVEERLPSNTRFPPRRTTPGTPVDSSEDTSSSDTYRVPTPSRGAVRPSLELVDSSSFRTHSGSPPVPDPSQTYVPSFPSVPGGPGAPVRFLGVSPEDKSSKVTDVYEPNFIPLIPDPKEEQIPTYTPARTRGRPAVQPTQLAADSPITTERPSETTTASILDDKSIYDLYAILQAQENTSNLVDGSTEEPGEDTGVDELSQEQDEKEYQRTTEVQATTPTTTAAPTTTTTTTTPAPTTTTTEATSRGRYRGRGQNRAPTQTQNRPSSRPSNRRFRRPDKGSSTTTEDASEVSSTSSPRTRNRYNSRGSSGSRSSYSRRTTTTSKPEEAQRDSTGEEQSPTPSRATVRGGNRFRPQHRQQTTSASSVIGNVGTGSRPTFADRYNLRRRGSTTTTAAPGNEEPQGDEDSTSEKESTGFTKPTIGTPARTRGRVNIANPIRPIARPGPRISLHSRGRLGSTTTTTAAPSEPDDGVDSPKEPEHPLEESQGSDNQDIEEEKEGITTPPPNPLTRLRNRPRLRITEKPPHSRPVATNRRQLVSSLLPRRRPGQAQQEEEAKPQEDEEQEEDANAPEEKEKEEVPEVEHEVSSTTAAPEEGNRLSLLTRKRGRRPGTLFNHQRPTHHTEEGS